MKAALPPTIITEFLIDEDFHSLYPESSLFFPPETPSSHIWAALLYTHPKSKLFNESPTTRRSIIVKDYLKDPSFDFESLNPIIEIIKLRMVTKAERLMITWEKKLHERDELLDSTPYTLDNIDILDKVMDRTPKLWNQYFTILEQLEKEESSLIGEAQESLLEKGDL